MRTWASESVFYHIYPIGFCGAPKKNSIYEKRVNRIEKIENSINHLNDLGINAVYLGPIFESEEHGYDTIDYFNVDRRLGSNDNFKHLVNNLHNNGIRIILDGVFNHVSRHFFAFQDVLKNRESSKYKNWFQNINFNGNNPYSDGFDYETWDGHYNLVKLDLKNSEVKAYLFKAINMWIQDFNIDGLRLDAADTMDFDFFKELVTFTKSLKRDFWITGEVVHGDYSRWANKEMLNSTTNYECYKGLHSSHNDKNFFEIAYSLNRQFNENGIYKDLELYNFVDNHDVNRISEVLKTRSHIFTTYALLFTIPGVPSIYYGSEFGISGRKNGNDYDLRPEIDLYELARTNNNLKSFIKKLIITRRDSEALKYGNYKEIYVNHEQFVFKRETDNEAVIVAVNSSQENANIKLNNISNTVYDFFNNESVELNELNELSLFPNSIRIMKV